MSVRLARVCACHEAVQGGGDSLLHVQCRQSSSRRKAVVYVVQRTDGHDRVLHEGARDRAGEALKGRVVLHGCGRGERHLWDSPLHV